MSDRRRIVGRRATRWSWRGQHRVTLMMGAPKRPHEWPQHGLRRVAGPGRRLVRPAPRAAPADGHRPIVFGRRGPQAPRVLIVHAHRLAAEALRTLLEEDGMEILALPSRPEEGMEAVRRDRPDLILLDLGLLAGGGIRLVRGILREGGEARVVAITPKGGLALEREAAHNGFQACLTADMAPSRLVEAIRDVLNLL